MHVSSAFYMSGIVIAASHGVSEISQQPFGVGTIIISIESEDYIKI